MTEARKGEPGLAGKVLIVAALLVAAVAVLTLKERNRPQPATPAADAKLPKLVDLGAGKCVPCKLMEPVLEELRQKCAGRLEVIFVDVGKDPDAGKPYGIRVIPTQIFYDACGKELFRHEGFFPKEEILAKYRELGVDLGVEPAAPEESASCGST